MPVPPPNPQNLHPALTARAERHFADAKVEISGGHAWLLLKGCRFDLGKTPREALSNLDEQLRWFSEALKTAKSVKSVKNWP